MLRRRELSQITSFQWATKDQNTKSWKLLSSLVRLSLAGVIKKRQSDQSLTFCESGASYKSETTQKEVDGIV